MSVQNKVPNPVPNPVDDKLTLKDFETKIRKLNADLETGKMWLNKRCETVKKDVVFVRWIKCIISTLLTVKLLSSIKVDEVAKAYFKFIEKHKDYLFDEEVHHEAKKVLNTLNDRTEEKHAQELKIYQTAIDGLLSNFDDQYPEDQKIANVLNDMSDAERFAFFKTYGIKLPTEKEENVNLPPIENG